MGDERILCVDDEPKVLSAIRRQLHGKFQVDLAGGAEQALRSIAENGPYAVVLADMRMPGMNGADLLAVLRARAPHTVRVMLTGNVDARTAGEAVNKGHVFRLLAKPCAQSDLVDALGAALEQHRLLTAERELLDGTLRGSVRVLSEMLAMVAPSAFGRAAALRELARAVAERTEPERSWEVEMATMVAWIGYLTIPVDLVERAESGQRLTAHEASLLEQVPEIGAQLLEEIPRLDGVAAIVRYQAKNFDGTGFPSDRVKGTDIPLGARILRALSELDRMIAAGAGAGEALADLESRVDLCDSTVVARVAAVVDETRPELGTLPPIPIPFAHLRPGHVLASPIFTLDGRRILNAGQAVGPVVLLKLRNHKDMAGIQEPILIESSRSPAAAARRRSA